MTCRSKVYLGAGWEKNTHTPIGGGGGGPGEIIVYNKIKAQDNEAKTEKDQNHT